MGEDQKKKVLVVDDEPDVITYLETLLSDHGYAVISARNGKEGLEKARQEKPDLVSLDISMPEESGVRCYRDIKEDPDLANTPVIMVTAVTGHGGDPGVFEKFISSRKQVPPPDGFFSKPIDKAAYLEKVAEVLGSTSV